MCEICDLLKEYDKAVNDLTFRIKQQGHELRMGNAAEADSASASAVNALHALLNCQKRMAAMSEKLGKDPEFISELMEGRKPPSMH